MMDVIRFLLRLYLLFNVKYGIIASKIAGINNNNNQGYEKEIEIFSINSPPPYLSSRRCNNHSANKSAVNPIAKYKSQSSTKFFSSLFAYGL